MCNGATHKVRADGTRISCENGKFTVVKGRKGRTEEENSESETAEYSIKISFDGCFSQAVSGTDRCTVVVILYRTCTHGGSG